MNEREVRAKERTDSSSADESPRKKKKRKKTTARQGEGGRKATILGKRKIPQNSWKKEKKMNPKRGDNFPQLPMPDKRGEKKKQDPHPDNKKNSYYHKSEKGSIHYQTKREKRDKPTFP